jgi:hypothetical protein
MTITEQWITALCWLVACIMIVALVAVATPATPASSCYAPKNQLHPQIQWDPKTWGRGLA